MVGLGQVGIGDGDDHIHFATLQLGANSIAEIQLRKAQLVGQLHLKIQLFAVEGFNFYRYFFCIVGLLGDAVTRHGTNHKS